MTKRELRQDKLRKIAELKQQLKDTDYLAIKHFEGEISAVDYAPIRDNRRAWRAEINALETEINVLMKG